MKKFKGSILSILISSLVLFLIYGDIATSPNQHLFALGGDGVKNYYTPAYYMKFDSGIHFTGMNHPFGEHVIFTDNQFFISATLGFIHDHVIELDEHVIGILNSLMLWSIVLSSLFLFLILRHLGLNISFAILFGLIIAFLSPQINRFVGHYALAYSLFIPLIWYEILMLIKYAQKSKYKGAFMGLLLTTSILVFAFIQPYYLLMAVLFCLAYSLILFINSRNSAFVSLIIGFAGIISLGIFYGWLTATDPYSDRLEDPWGFYIGMATFESVFFPLEGVLFKFWDSIFHLRIPNWEGWAYAGLPVWYIFVRLFESIIKSIKSRNFKKYTWRKIKMPVLNRELKILFWASIVLYLFSMGLPFSAGMDWLLDAIPPIKQFRSLGRFAWFIYYGLGIMSAYHLYLLWRNNRSMVSLKQKRIGAIVLLLIGIWSFEAVSHNIRKLGTIGNKIEGNNQFYKYQGNSDWQPSKYQAILPLPYTHMGSEKIYLARSNRAMFRAMALSYDSGLPLLTGEMSRTSLGVTFDMVQLMSDPLISKNMREELGEQSIVVIYDGKEELNRHERRIVDAAIWKDVEAGYYEIPLSAFDSKADSAVAYIEREKDSLVRYGNFYAKRTLTNLYHDGFEDDPLTEESIVPFYGSSCFYQKEGESTLFEILFRDNEPIDVTFSLWVGNSLEICAFPTVKYMIYNIHGGEVHRRDIHPKEAMDVLDGWVRVEWETTLFPGHRHLVQMKGQDQIADEMMIREKGVDVYEKREDGWWLNNYPLLE